MNETYIKDINIIKVRHLNNFNISLSKNERKHLILTGKNGSGKTSILDSIQMYLKAIEDNLLYELLETSNSIQVANNLLAKAESQRQIKSQTDYINNLKERKNRYFGNLELSFNSINNLISKYNEGNYILAYFNAKRTTNVILSNNITKINFNNKYGMKENISDKFVEYLVYLKTQQSFAANENDYDVVNKIKTWFNNFEKALIDIFDDQTLKLKFDYKNYDFKIIVKDREPFGFNVLSDGYSAILNIVMELILRMEKNVGYPSNNQSKKYIYDIEGIVLIDEIETHLHIELQKKCLPFLVELFPKIQFIITTHSPFVLTSLDNVVIYDLENKFKIENLSMYSYEGIVESYFNVDQYSNKIKKKMNRYIELTEKKDMSQIDKDEILELRKYFNDIPEDLAPELVYKFRELDLKRGDIDDKL